MNSPDIVSIKRPEPRGGAKPARRPDWLKVRLPSGQGYRDVRSLVHTHNLHTVCESARCPNVGECWARRTATFMILGDVCTRSCGFCAVKTGRPGTLDRDEPRRVAQAVKSLRLRHAVITSVNRDELADGGAEIFAETIRLIRLDVPGCTVEVLVPDFQGSRPALDIVLDAMPDIFNHNIETVPRLYRRVRPQANFQQSLAVISYAKALGANTKSGMMLGIGERPDEVAPALAALHEAGCDIVTLGQYLQPTGEHLPVDRFVEPVEFDHWTRLGLELGFKHVQSGPLVRSSYHADEQIGELAVTR